MENKRDEKINTIPIKMAGGRNSARKQYFEQLKRRTTKDDWILDWIEKFNANVSYEKNMKKEVRNNEKSV